MPAYGAGSECFRERCFPHLEHLMEEVVQEFQVRVVRGFWLVYIYTIVILDPLLSMLLQTMPNRWQEALAIPFGLIYLVRVVIYVVRMAKRRFLLRMTSSHLAKG